MRLNGSTPDLRFVSPGFLAWAGGFAARCAAVGIACVLSLPACRQVLGIDPVGDDHGQSAGCRACVASECGEESRACGATPSCQDRYACLDSCEAADPACEASCTLGIDVEPYDGIAAFTGCRAEACARECALRCGALTLASETSLARSCDDCATAECCEESAACGAILDCRLILDCIRSKGTPDGVQGCQSVRHPAGTDSYFALDSCLHTRCATECAYGNDWSCQTRADVARPTGDEVAVTVRVLDASQKALAGVEAKLCRGTDPGCANPVDDAVSGQDGRAHLTATTVTTSGRAPVDGLILLHDPAGARLDTIVNLFPPLSEPKVEFPAITASASELAEAGSLLDEVPDPERGQVIATAVDCAFRRARGLRVSIEPADPPARVYYCMGTIPLRNGSQTDSFGNALVVNAPPGTITLTATTAEGRVVSRTPVIVVAGRLSIAMLAPTPP